MNDSKLEYLIQGVSDQIGGLRTDLQGIFPAKSANLGSSPESPYSTIVIDLTTAHVNEHVTVVNPAKFVQFWTDGGLEGITVKLGQQSAVGLNLNQMRTIPVNVVYTDLYLTNDIRQGRSILVIYFVHQNTPLDLTLAGQDISLTELAVRNGSYNTFDRRGRVIWQDSFEDGLQKWAVSATGLAEVNLTTVYARSGSVSARMYNPAAETVQLSKTVPWAAQNRFGYEKSFIQDSATGNDKFKIEITAYDGANSHGGQIIWNHTLERLYYMNSAGAEVLIDTGVTLDSYLDFNTLKLVIDPEIRQYARVILNGYAYSLKNIPLYTAVAAVAPKVECITTLQTVDGASPATVYVDDAIITRDE